MRSLLLLTLLSLLLLIILLPSSSLILADDDTSHLPTYYELLELSPTASSSEIKRSYRRLALIHHPDKSPNPDRSTSESYFITLSDAYEVLSSPQLRPRYDYLLTQHIHRYSDTIRDWPHFNEETGKFDKQKGSEVVWGDGRFSFGASRSWEDVRVRWEREKEEEEREKRALWMALLGSVGVGLIPVGWFYWKRVRQWWIERRKKGQASDKLREEQIVLTELQQEKQREEEKKKEDRKQWVAEIKRRREEAIALQAAQAEEEDEGQKEEVEVASAEGVGAEQVEQVEVVPVEDDDEGERRVKKDGVVVKCDVCRKKFKSQAQLDNHLVSNAHKKAVKEAGLK